MRRWKRRLFVTLFLLFLLVLLIYYLFSVKIRPVLLGVAENRVSDTVVRTVNQIISDRLSDGSIQYSDIVTLEKGTDGRITAIVTDMAAANRLRATLTNDIIVGLGGREVTELAIPMGNFLGSPFLTGLGPKINVRILSVTSVDTAFSNRFTSAGINQTRHEIMLNIDVGLTILAPMSKKSLHIPTQVCVAETVIIGEVPNSYTNKGDTNER